MRKTVIDIGTNTILMLIADFDKQNSVIKPLLDIQKIPRLGKGVDKNRNIPPESVEKAIEILNEYKKISNEHKSEQIITTATSFIRDANNRDEFIKSVNESTGIKIEILSGEDEARWTFWGGVYDKLKITNYKLRIASIDIGGGSTEITTGTVKQLPISDKVLKETEITSKSLDIDSVRVNERFLSSHPPAFESVAEAENFINEHFRQIDFNLTNTHLIGVAGTITTLGAVKLKLDKFESAKVDGLVITIDEIEHILSTLSAQSLEELYLMGDYMTGRADIIIPGILILKCFIRKFGFEKITISTKGLRYGIFLREVL
ncbi:MAG: Ppx/GppA family phosphatase [Chlorobi bacterium]|nr:Ppx/GppA family phosphatase [Chlorobiota bacterium]MCI0715302.1 Ppx/GppA family phosphatase [Chlorobiota bacterium]